MERPEPVFIGFFPKHTEPGALLKQPGIEEICSVSECMSQGPKNWVERWRHNTMTWLYDTEAAAVQMTVGEVGRCDLYAYRVFPVLFDGADETPVPMPVVDEPSLGDYEFLGYDVVENIIGGPGGCSPLSCNGGCEVFRVNRYCLLDDLDYAWETCARIATEAAQEGAWEPGPYYLVEVLRKRRAPAGKARK